MGERRPRYYLLPDVLYDLPSRVGLAFDLSAIGSGIYGAILVLTMLLQPQGLVPARRHRPVAASTKIAR